MLVPVVLCDPGDNGVGDGVGVADILTPEDEARTAREV